MKTFKKIFSRFSLVALTIVILFVFDVVVFLGAVYILREIVLRLFPGFAAPLTVVFAVLDFLILLITVLSIANRDMVPEAKIPWLICIMAFNMVGVIMYAVFAHNRLSRRQQRKLRKAVERSLEMADFHVDSRASADDFGRFSGVSEALLAANPAALVYDGTRTQYFPCGEKFAESFCADLERAQRYIFLEYFIIAKGVFWNKVIGILERKAKEGVTVRVLYDDIGSMSRVHMNYHRTLRRRGIDCIKFNPFVPVVAEVHNNRDHRKIAVIDGVIGYTGGINLADEYMNITHPYGYFKDVALRMEGPAVRSFVLMFLQLFNIRKKEEEDYRKFLPESYERFEGEGYVQPYGDGPRPFYGRALGEDVYINILSTAKKYVYIMTPYLVIDYRLREALVLAAQRGVDVRILQPGIPDKKVPFALARSNYTALIRGGVKIYAYREGFVHAKCFLADDELAVVGTINLDYRSFLFHFEDAVLMLHTKALPEIREDFERSFEKSVLLREEDAKKNVVSRGICEIAKLFAPLF